MRIYCDAERCEYNKDGRCFASEIHLNEDAVCLTWPTGIEDENEEAAE